MTQAMRVAAVACLAGLFGSILTGRVPAADTAGDKPSFGDPSEQAYLSRSYLFVESSAIEAYLRSIVQRLLAGQPAGDGAGEGSDRIFAKARGARVPDVFVYSSDAFAASTDASDNLLISTGTLRDIDSEDELAALLAHEISHILLKHNQRKSAMRSFPLGVETAGWVAAAADRTAGDGRTGAVAPTLSEFGKDALVNTQAASLIWSDILMPTWNRGQERAADRAGFDLMRAAGYDPAAFGSLFTKLRDAQARRSERMQALRAIAEQRVLAANQPNSNDGLAVQATDAVKTKVQTITVDAVFDALMSFNRDYDAPEQRQRLLAEYADQQGRLRADKRPRSPQFRQQLRAGGGGAQLSADRSAIATMRALNSRRTAEARSAVAPLLQRTLGAEPISPHLNLALGAWYLSAGQTASAEARVRAWVRSTRPPAQAYVWQAYLQWNRKQYHEVIQTLERGRRRIGQGAPFLPHLVTAAQAIGDKEKAEDYVRQCAAEDRKGPNAVVSMITFRGAAAPTGIYGECMRRLGYQPQQQGIAKKAITKPVELGKKGVEKVKGLFRREKPGPAGDGESSP